MTTTNLQEHSLSLSPPTIWGFEPTEFHDRFWISQGIQVIREGERDTIDDGVIQYLLVPSRTLVIFEPRQIRKLHNLTRQGIVFFQIRATVDDEYREVAVATESRFERIQRVYRQDREVSLALTSDRGLARLWQSSIGGTEPWSILERQSTSRARYDSPIAGRIYNGGEVGDPARCLRDMMMTCPDPDAIVGRVTRLNGTVWADQEAQVTGDVRFVGPVWIGAGRQLEDESVVGPAILWDSPEARPEKTPRRWNTLRQSSSRRKPEKPRPATTLSTPRGQERSFYSVSKRAFDIVFVLGALIVTLPFYAVFMLVILIGDGWPCFFAHRRESVGGKVFPCFKFRTMKKNAEEIKARLMKENQVDGPQFFMTSDPRLIPCARLMRKYKIDEFPQFLNVLLGHMSVVGPRPSPFNENQFCPAWREARLSVRPGLTGLWQVMRTREEGLDFLEWIRYDIEYVEKASWRLDLWILLKTFKTLVKGS